MVLTLEQAKKILPRQNLYYDSLSFKRRIRILCPWKVRADATAFLPRDRLNARSTLDAFRCLNFNGNLLMPSVNRMQP